MKNLFGKRRSIGEVQAELNLDRPREPDRNSSLGGRSFYFFDFDDNIAFLSTPIFIFHKSTGQPLELTSGEYAKYRNSIGKFGLYEDYEISFDEEGSFRAFRDRKLSLRKRILGGEQDFVKDVRDALSYPDLEWKGPSWRCFYHAVFNQRPISLITARGHRPETIKEGVREFVNEGFLPLEPNYLSIFPVNHPATQSILGFPQTEKNEVSLLKRKAIRASVEMAMQHYGESPYHRFGMSDDDPKNLELIVEEMADLKKDFPKNSFYVIDTHNSRFVKKEVFSGYTLDQNIESHHEQLSLI